MNATVKRLIWGALVGIALVILIAQVPAINIPIGPSTLTLVGVYESKDLSKYPQEQLTWLRGVPFSTKMKEAGHAYYVVDKDIKDKDDKRPPDLVPFLDAVDGETLPALTIRRAGAIEVNCYGPKTLAEAEDAVKKEGG